MCSVLELLPTYTRITTALVESCYLDLIIAVLVFSGSSPATCSGGGREWTSRSPTENHPLIYALVRKPHLIRSHIMQTLPVLSSLLLLLLL